MDLLAEILKEHSRQQSEKVAKWIGDDNKRFAELMDLFLHDEQLIAQHAAWIMSVVVEKQPQMAVPYQRAMVKRMAEPGTHDAIKRNVVRVLQVLEIPEELHGDVMNICFDFLVDPNEAIAIRAFSMTVLYNISKHYPEIKQELKAVLENALEHENASPGFRNRAGKILSNLR